MASRIDGDFYFTGSVSFVSLLSNGGTLGDAAIKANAGIQHTKLQHQHRVKHNQPNTTATAETRAVYECYGQTGTVLNVQAGIIGPCVGAATITVDVKKNGTTILSAPISLDNTVAAYGTKTGTITVPALAAGDVLSVVTTATAGGGTIGTGLFVALTIAEDAQ